MGCHQSGRCTDFTSEVDIEKGHSRRTALTIRAGQDLMYLDCLTTRIDRSPNIVALNHMQCVNVNVVACERYTLTLPLFTYTDCTNVYPVVPQTIWQTTPKYRRVSGTCWSAGRETRERERGRYVGPGISRSKSCPLPLLWGGAAN
jgi:hypothetical protein